MESGPAQQEALVYFSKCCKCGKSLQAYKVGVVCSMNNLKEQSVYCPRDFVNWISSLSHSYREVKIFSLSN